MAGPPMPLPIDDAGVLLVGGTFDPPHVAHIRLPALARDARMPGAALVFVPAARSPHKADGPRISDADRVALVACAARGVPRAGVWRDEIDRAAEGEPSYWVETVRRARRLVGERPLGFVIGSDQAVAFDRWREARAILALAEPVVLLREPWGTPDLLRDAIAARGFWSSSEIARLCAAAADATDNVGVMDVSSTAVRALLGGDRQHARLEQMLDPGVLSMIRERGLYRARD